MKARFLTIKLCGKIKTGHKLDYGIQNTFVKILSVRQKKPFLHNKRVKIKM